MKDIDALKQVNRSGFPFQLKVERDIEASGQVLMHKWSVAGREHGWADADGNAGYADVVLKHNEYGARIVIECKRVKADDAQQLKWLFLVEEAKSDSTNRASCFEVEANADLRVWDDVHVLPPSLESQFCVLRGDEPGRGTLLESLAKGLLCATEGIASEEINLEKSIREVNQRLYGRLFMFPVIVTNARITVCRFDPKNVKLDLGVLEASDAEIDEVPFIRFRKSLVTGFPEGRYFTLEAVNRARERTVLVVNAGHLIEVLKDWRMDRMPGQSYALESLLQRPSQT